MFALGTPGVEPENRQIGQRRQAVGGLAEQMAVHHPAVGRQRVHTDHRCDRGLLFR